MSGEPGIRCNPSVAEAAPLQPETWDFQKIPPLGMNVWRGRSVFRPGDLKTDSACNGRLRSDAIDQAPDAPGVGVPEFLREQHFGDVLKTKGTDESEKSAQTDGGEMRMGSGRVGTAMVEGGTDLQPGWISVDHEPTDFSLQNLDEFAEFSKIFRRAMEGCA